VNGVEWARTFSAYDRWMNERFYALSADLPDAERRRDRGAFFRSIHGTLNHGLIGDRVQTLHRGQLTTLLTQEGVDPGVTDLMWLPGLVTTEAAT
jgi:uncharacterized damage-inducible protein DinB